MRKIAIFGRALFRPFDLSQRSQSAQRKEKRLCDLRGLCERRKYSEITESMVGNRTKARFLRSYFFAPSAASVAQLVELLICNQSVGGSSPSAGSNDNLVISDHRSDASGSRRLFFILQSAFRSQSGGVPERPKGTDCKSVGEAYGGSNPPPSTKPHSKLCVGEAYRKGIV